MLTLMKIIIQPSNPEQSFNHTSIIESSQDCLTCEQMVDLFRYALLGYGFTDKSVSETLPEPQTITPQNHE